VPKSALDIGDWATIGSLAGACAALRNP